MAECENSNSIIKMIIQKITITNQMPKKISFRSSIGYETLHVVYLYYTGLLLVEITLPENIHLKIPNATVLDIKMVLLNNFSSNPCKHHC